MPANSSTSAVSSSMAGAAEKNNFTSLDFPPKCIFFTCFDEGCDQGHGKDQGKGEVPVGFPNIKKNK